MTADELLRLPDDNLRHELVRGELRTYPLRGAEHGMITAEFGWLLGGYVRPRRLGKVFAAGTGFLIATDLDTVRAADVSFVRQERLVMPPPPGYCPFAPDLVAEVISPGDSYLEVNEKVHEWLAAGTRMVLVVNPRRRTVAVHRSPTNVTVLTEADQIEGGDVVPGWVLPVRALFGGEG
jgi:Uma2 family endonuclease